MMVLVIRLLMSNKLSFYIKEKINFKNFIMISKLNLNMIKIMKRKMFPLTVFTFILFYFFQFNAFIKKIVTEYFHNIYHMTVTWHKGDRELMYSQRHRIIMCGTLHTMEIPSCMTLDKGEYIVRATNCHGYIESRCKVSIVPAGYVLTLIRYKILVL